MEAKFPHFSALSSAAGIIYPDASRPCAGGLTAIVCTPPKDAPTNKSPF